VLAGDQLLYSSTITVRTHGEDFDFGLEDINALWVIPDTSTGTKDAGTYAAGPGHHIALDNIVISKTSTPEPGTPATLAPAGALLGGAALRRRRRPS